MNNRSQTLTNVLIAGAIAVAAAVWWDAFKSPVVFVLTLGILVFIHEWGHFIAARSCGVHCYEFALGFGPKLATYMRRGGTEYTIRALPLGGFVNIKGMQPDDPVTPDGLNGRRPAERALVYLAGPLMNVILGAVLFLVQGAAVGTPDHSQVIVGPVTKGKEATRARIVRKNGEPVSGLKPGLQVGDRVLDVNGQKVDSRDVVIQEISANANKTITLRVQRGKDLLEFEATPQLEKDQNQYLVITKVPESNEIGVQEGDQLSRIDGVSVATLVQDEQGPAEAAVERILRERAGKAERLTVWRNGAQRLELEGSGVPLSVAIKPGERQVGKLGFSPLDGAGPRVGLAKSVSLGSMQILGWFEQIGAMFRKGPQGLSESVGGPISIFNILQQVNRLPGIYYFNVLASLSLSLALFNLFPIPVLDGGHMLVLTWEVLRRRRLEPETQKVVQLVGLAIIGVIFVLIMGKDISGLLH